MVEKEKYIKDNFDSWKEKYDFPEYMDFNIKTLFGLQYDLNTIPADHVMNKKTLLDMILRIQGSLPSSVFKDKDKT